MTCLLVIPARWGSGRFPGKPLAAIAGRPLLARTIDLARRATAGVADIEIVVATDDDRVESLARSEHCAVARTEPALSSGSARALAAARQRTPIPATIVNLQGDAPFIPPAAIKAVVNALRENGAEVVTPVTRLTWPALDALRRQKMIAPFSGTTCIVAPDLTARWFSKAIIPAIRDEDERRRTEGMSPVFRHLGLYGYTMDALIRFDAAPPSRHEQLEGLEQLRLIDLSIAVQTVQIDTDWQCGMTSIGGIDTPSDVELAERLIARFGDPSGA